MFDTFILPELTLLCSYDDSADSIFNFPARYVSEGVTCAPRYYRKVKNCPSRGKKSENVRKRKWSIFGPCRRIETDCAPPLPPSRLPLFPPLPAASEQISRSGYDAWRLSVNIAYNMTFCSCPPFYHSMGKRVEYCNSKANSRREVDNFRALLPLR